MSTDIITLVDAQREQFGKVVSVKGIDFDREREFALQIFEAKPNDYFRKVATANPQTFANAIINVAAIGISLNPASKLAYLVPRKDAICLDISYMGLMHIAQECGAIQWGQAVIVRAADKFQLRGLDQQPVHEYEPFKPQSERGAIVGVYCVVKTDGGDYLTHVMQIDAVHAIRDRSEAYKRKTGPWITDPEEMIKKTCVKQAAKYWPRRERLDTAVHHMNTEGGEGVTLQPNKMSDEEFDTWKTKIQSTDTKDAAKAVWREGVKVCEGLGDVETANKLKAALLAHAFVLDEAEANAKQEKAA